MKSLIMVLLMACAFGARPARAQLPHACSIVGTVDLPKLRACIDTVEWRRKTDSTRMSDAIARLEMLEKRGVASTPASVVQGDLIVNGQVCIGGPCKPNTPYQLQLLATGSTGILGVSNMNGKNPQGAETHFSAVTFGEDGGLRLEHNYWYQNAVGLWPESAKPRTVIGFDSQGTPSISQDYNGEIYPAQSMIIVFDRNQRTAWIQSMKAGWKIGFCVSPRLDNNCENSYWTVPTPP
jgi:hypothetical protein